SVQKDRKRALAQAGVLIESPEIYPSLTPNQALEMVADLRGVPSAERRDRIRSALEEVKMADWADKRVGRFSKGMKQRINIAAALVHDPSVVVLDEPSTGLDPPGDGRGPVDHSGAQEEPATDLHEQSHPERGRRRL
ncbi:lantibiotic ABC transporter,ATP-binding protein, partial [mine drainage metagenome]